MHGRARARARNGSTDQAMPGLESTLFAAQGMIKHSDVTLITDVKYCVPSSTDVGHSAVREGRSFETGDIKKERNWEVDDAEMDSTTHKIGLSHTLSSLGAVRGPLGGSGVVHPSAAVSRHIITAKLSDTLLRKRNTL